MRLFAVNLFPVYNVYQGGYKVANMGLLVSNKPEATGSLGAPVWLDNTVNNLSELRKIVKKGIFGGTWL